MRLRPDGTAGDCADGQPVRRIVLRLLFALAVGLMITPAAAEPEGLEVLNAAIAAETAGEVDRALVLYGEALSAGGLSHEEIVRGSFSRGTLLLRQEEYARAIADFDTAIWLDKTFVEAYQNRGLARFQLGRTDEAIADFDTALALAPDLAIGWNNRGNAWRRKGEYARAITDYDKVVEIEPDYAHAYFNRGLAYSGLAEKQGAGGPDGEAARAAEADFRRAYELAPDHPAIRERAEALGLNQQ